jgi:hypothetical protein
MTPTPEPVGSDAKEVFAFFGLAAYHGQVLEQELIIFAVMLHLSGHSRVRRDVVEGLFERLEVRTFGQLLREARSLTTIPENLEGKLTAALARRNDLAHRFFARHSEDFYSEVGRGEMINELTEATALFKDVDAAVTALREPISNAIGFAPDAVQAELDSMRARAEERDRNA